MLTTLENVRLREGDRVIVSLNSGEVEAEVVNADDPAKLKVSLIQDLSYGSAQGDSEREN